MSFNICKILELLYKNTNNYFCCCNVDGTPAQQYAQFEWDSKTDPVTDKPTLQYLEDEYIKYGRQNSISEMESYAADLLENNFIAYSGNQYSSSKVAINKIIGRAANGDKSRYLFDKNKQKHMLTKSDYGTLLSLYDDLVEEYDLNIEYHTIQINLSTDPDNYDYTTGWPSNPYGE